MARSADPVSYAAVVGCVYLSGIPFGVLAADDRAVREIEDALRIAERSGDDLALTYAQMTLGLALVHRQPLRSMTADSICWPGQRSIRARGITPVRVTDCRRVLGTGEGSAWRSR